jgi:hypothetical protein
MDEADLSLLKTTCKNISENIKALFPSMRLYFLLGDIDKKSDTLASLLPEINNHVAFNSCYPTLKKWANSEEGTSYLGFSVAEEGILFSFKRKNTFLAFIAVDTAIYADYNQAIQDVHRLTASFIDSYINFLKSPTKKMGHLSLKNLAEVELSFLNLKSDIYSTLHMIKEGQYDSATKLAKQRCIEALTPQTTISPQFTPFAMAMDILEYTIEEQISASLSTRNQSAIIATYQLASHISQSFDTDNIKAWMEFVNNSQIMAWTGFTASQILGAAINTSDNPYIKLLGHMVAEITNLAPTDEDHLPNGYNPFLNDEINKIRHESYIEETLEMILTHVVEADSHIPFIRVANKQNEGLLKGRISGWCANALYASAKAYLQAQERGVPAIQAARLEFQSSQTQISWENLYKLGAHCVSMCRKGTIPTLELLLDYTKQNQDMRFITDSLNISLLDPNFSKIHDDPLETTKPNSEKSFQSLAFEDGK